MGKDKVAARPIKFRIWDKSSKDMRNWQFVKTMNMWAFENEPFVFMLYTGLKDKNGKEIYEGDVVEHNVGGMGIARTENMVVEWIGETEFDGCAYFKPFGNHEAYSTYGTGVEVIGNIYENPQLLTQIGEQYDEITNNYVLNSFGLCDCF